MGRASGKPPGRPLSDAVRMDVHAPWTWSANPGATVYGETLRKAKHGEWRRWDPVAPRSPLACFAPPAPLSVSFHQPVTTCSTWEPVTAPR